MDISDILASVSAPRLPQRALDQQALTRAWINERTAPELLPYPSALITRCSRAVAEQIDVLETMAGEMDPAANFALVILQTELERYRFLLRSFLRARIAKIDRAPLHYRNLLAAAAEDAGEGGVELEQPILSPLETQYLTAHQALLSAHYQASFLTSFPQQLQKLDDTSGSVSMVDKPDRETAVFCRVLRDTRVPGVYEDLELARGDVYVLRWSSVHESVKRGNVELI